MNYKDLFYLRSDEETLHNIKKLIDDCFLNTADDINQTLLGMAVLYRRYDLIKYLIEAGADIEMVADNTCMTPIEIASEFPDFRIIKMLVEAGANVANGSRALGICASARADIDIIRYLVEAGANVNGEYDGNSVLWWVCQGMNKDVLEYLLKNGADPNLHYDTYQTCLNQAIADAFIPGVKLLIEYGADLNYCHEYGSTPLHIAATYCYPAIDILLNAGVDINVVDELGRTVLFEERVRNRFDSCDYLIKRGADPYIKDKFGFDFFSLDDDELRRSINEEEGYFEEE